MRKFALTIALFASMLLTGCAISPMALPQAGAGYKPQEFGIQRPVVTGTVQAVRDVKVEGQGGMAGTVGGGLLGALAGSHFGGGLGKKLMTVAGGIGGAVVGNSVQKSMTTVDAVEITVRLDSGTTVSVLQPKEDGFAPKKGDQVRLVGERTNARVVPV